MSSKPIASLVVEIDARAWAQLGRLSTDVFRRVREHMDALVHAASSELVARAELTPGVPLRVDVGEFILKCAVDADRSLLKVVGVERREGTPSRDA